MTGPVKVSTEQSDRVFSVGMVFRIQPSVGNDVVDIPIFVDVAANDSAPPPGVS